MAVRWSNVVTVATKRVCRDSVSKGDSKFDDDLGGLGIVVHSLVDCGSPDGYSDLMPSPESGLGINFGAARYFAAAWGLGNSWFVICCIVLISIVHCTAVVGAIASANVAAMMRGTLGIELSCGV